MSIEDIAKLDKRQLVVGCGKKSKLVKRMGGGEFGNNLVTLDINPDHDPDVVWNLDSLPLPFEENEFDEVHAYDVLEHLGKQGDWLHFFAFFSELWRIMKPGAFLFASVPHWLSMWAWGDPSHTRVITPGTLPFLSQKEYKEQVGKTAMSDYRRVYSADFDIAHRSFGDDADGDPAVFTFILTVVKPEQ